MLARALVPLCNWRRKRLTCAALSNWPCVLPPGVPLAVLASVIVSNVLLAYYYCLLLATKLSVSKCRHVRDVINAANPHSDESWERKIAPQLRSIHEDVLAPISAEFGPPLVFICGVMVLITIVSLPHVLTGTPAARGFAAGLPVIGFAVFLMFAYPPANATTESRKVFNALNNLRCLRESTGLRGFLTLIQLERISQLESYYGRLNSLQGPGFALHFASDPELTLVISLGALYRIAAQLVVLFSVIFPSEGRAMRIRVPLAQLSVQSGRDCVACCAAVRCPRVHIQSSAPHITPPSLSAAPDVAPGSRHSYGRDLRGRGSRRAWRGQQRLRTSY